MVRTFGAPVIEPPGKQCRTAVSASTPGRSRPRTVDTSWCTVVYDSTVMNVGTSTVPMSQTRPRSLRNRSTIIMFSARFFGSRASSSRMSRSDCGSGCRGAVPLMGLDSTIASRVMRRNRSGDEQATR